MKNISLVLSLIFIPFFVFAVNKTVGASGADYLTDGSNDEVEIQQAVNYVSTNGGGTVTLFDGTYNIQSTRILAKSNVTLTGTSRDGTILSSTRTYDYIVFNTAEIRAFQLKNLTINPQNAYRASGVRFELVSKVLVENVRFQNVSCDGWYLVFGIDGNAAQNQDIFSRDNAVKNCLFDGHSGSLEMLLLFNSKNTLVENCIFQNKSGVCPVLGGQPALGMWQKTDSMTIKNCQFTNIAGYETIYYSNTSNNTLIEGCTFTNSGGIRGANESDWGTFGVAHATGLAIRSCTFTGGANSLTQVAIALGAVYNVLIKNCTITAYEEGIVFHQGYFTLNDLCKYFAVVNTTIYNCNPGNNVHDLHSGAYFQVIGGEMKGFFVCGTINDNQTTPTQRQPVSFYVYIVPHVTTYFSDLYFLGTTITAYGGRPKFKYLNDAAQGTPFVSEDCSGGSPPSYCSSCPTINDAQAVAWINTYDATTATIIQNLMNYQTLNPVLPVDILDFKGVAEKERNRLTWLLGDKRDVETITIRKSSNGRDFTPLSILGKNEIFFIEEKPFSQTYYQLTINELSGKSTKSKIILVEQKTKNKVQIYPSVTNGFLTIEHVPSFEIINSVGQVLLSEKAFYQSSVNIHHLPNGIYFVKGIDTEGSVFFQKIVKQ